MRSLKESELLVHPIEIFPLILVIERKVFDKYESLDAKASISQAGR
jgi:hypothetical protein